MKVIDAKGSAVLIIGDTHLPYEHSDYLDFVTAVSKHYGCTLHLHIGDYEDNHAISFHDSDQGLLSAGHELLLVIEKTKRWFKTFPELKTVSSNHGSLIFRRMKSQGLPVEYITPLRDLYETPTWKWYEDIMLRTSQGNVYICHGKTGTYNKLAREVGCSAVQGHFHGKLEITWCNSVLAERFNMFTGCGIDRKSLAFAYGKNNIPQPLLGCSVIDEEGNPIIVKMRLNGRNRWDGKI